MADANPVLDEWTGPFGLPPFDAIQASDFAPAFDAALAGHRAQIAAIAATPGEPSFADTLDALELSGDALERVCSVFFNLSATDSTPAIEAIEREMAPRLAKHWNDIYMNEALFARVDALFQARAELPLSDEQRRVLERTHMLFVRAGARLGLEQKQELAKIGERLAVLATQFGQNLLADERNFLLLLSAEDLAGLPDSLVQAMAQAAAERGHPEHFALTLSRSVMEPFLQYADRRDLRERAFKAWTMRGQSGGETDNRAIIAETIRLRTRRAQLLGYPSHAHFKLDDTMAKTPDAVRALLEQVWTRALARALREQADLEELAATQGAKGPLEPWDWRYYAEKVRRQKHAIDEAQIKPYLQLDAIIAAAFDTAHRLFGITASGLHGVALYHQDVRAWEIKDREGRPVGLFLGDYFARPGKRSGAWMSGFRGQQKLAGDIRPIIVNVMNFAKPAPGKPALLSFDDARTLFHEFGHALHGLLSDVTYPLLAGTSVAVDFVELPSQLYEHWLSHPQVLARFARHVETGEPMPAELLARLRAARNFNQGFSTVEYTASALVDLDLHLLEAEAEIEPWAFERAALERIGMPKAIAMRHRTPHFAHVFSGESYSSAYYSYLWSEVLDADAFAAFEETGDIFDPGTAQRLRRFVYAAGNGRPADAAYIAFRGRLPTPDALLAKRGLAPA
jgi:peptidyl-dipeptidase Dcp